MLIRNDTPFAAMSFGNLHRDGMTMAVICVRASYNVSIAGAPQLGNHQEVALNDIYEGDPQRTPMVRVGDLIPYKPAAPAASRTTRRSHDLAFWNPRGSETRLRRSSP